MIKILFNLIKRICGMLFKINKKYRIFIFPVLLVTLMEVAAVSAASPIENINFFGTKTETANSIKILLVLTVLSIAPSILIMTTGFTRIVIVLSFVRNALGTQQTPPNQVLVGMALFLTFFIMNPIIVQINETAYKPYMADEISQDEAFANAVSPIKSFMGRQVSDKDLALFMNMAGVEPQESIETIPLNVIIPAFITSEIKLAFQIGFFIFLPFIIIDMIVASTLMSMGMMMLPPAMISLPFKILLFVLTDGWGKIIESLIMGFK